MSTIRAGVYTRISKDQSNGLGVARQETQCRKLAEEKGWEVAKVYTDNDMSAYSGKPRPAYQQMLSDLQDGIVNAVVCVDLDRLTRQPRELEEFIVIANQTGAQLANVSGKTDLSTSEGRKWARDLGTAARFESEKKSERIKAKNDQLRSQRAPHTGGPRPFGYKPARTTEGLPTWKVVPDEAARIRRAIDDHLSGKSLNQITREWREAGVKTTRGNPPSATTVRRILGNQVYAGLLSVAEEVNGEVKRGPKPGNWEAIIDRETYEVISQKFMARRGKGSGGGRPAKNLLTGMLRCAYCDGPLYWRKSVRGVPMYVHITKVGRTPCDHPGLGVVAKGVEAHVSSIAVARLDSPEARAEMSQPLTDATSAKLEETEKALETLFHHTFVEQIVSVAHYKDGRVALLEKIDSLKKELGAPRPELPEGDPTTLWEQADTEERHRILGTLIDRITVTEGHPGEYDAKRISIHWRTD